MRRPGFMEWLRRPRGVASSVGRSIVQLDLSAEALEELNAIMVLAGTKNRADTIRDALRLYGWVLDNERVARDPVALEVRFQDSGRLINRLALPVLP